jgi:hypothetical protein
MDLSRRLARTIIERVGGPGQPPEYGFQFFTAGLDPYLSVINDEYLSSFVKEGGSSFKMVVGVYGGGKTHFLYNIRDLAWKNNFVVSYISLKPEESPFHKLELVYRAAARAVVAPMTPEEVLSGYEKGISSLLQIWYGQRVQEYQGPGLAGIKLRDELYDELDHLQGVESISFSKAVKAAFRSLKEGREEDFANICQWLNGEGYDRAVHSRYGILQRIDKTNAFTIIRSLSQWIRQIGFSGLVILLDEAERVPSLSSRQRELHLNNLRDIIDESGQTSLQGVMIFYAVPDESFLEGRTSVYEALKQRVGIVFEKLNPSGVKIELEKLVLEPIPFLREIGGKLVQVYEIANDYKFQESIAGKTTDLVANLAYEQRFGDIGYKRIFVQKLIHALNFAKRKGSVPTPKDLG